MEWAARERVAERWGHTATTVQWLVAAFTGKVVRASEIVPPGIVAAAVKKPPRVMTPEEEEQQMRHTGDFMDQAFLAAFGR